MPPPFEKQPDWSKQTQLLPFPLEEWLLSIGRLPVQLPPRITGITLSVRTRLSDRKTVKNLVKLRILGRVH